MATTVAQYQKSINNGIAKVIPGRSYADPFVYPIVIRSSRKWVSRLCKGTKVPSCWKPLASTRAYDE